MRILAVDTTFGACSVALREGAKILARRFERMERGHAEALAPMVQAAIEESGILFSDLDRLGVTTGPGTFTGQRVGLAFMRGLRIALKRPLVGVTSLRAMACQAMAETGEKLAASIHDARRDEVYFEALGGGETGARLMRFEDAVLAVIALARGGPVALAGTASLRVHEICAAKNISTRTTEIAAPDADWVARLCAEAPLADEVPRPLYLREPDAKLPVARP